MNEIEEKNKVGRPTEYGPDTLEKAEQYLKECEDYYEPYYSSEENEDEDDDEEE